MYHLEHSSGFKPDSSAVKALNERLDRAAVPQVTMDQLKGWILTMYRQKAPIVFNGADWGFARDVFPEEVRRRPSPPRRRRCAHDRVHQDPGRGRSGYWNRRPCNIRHSPKPVGSREYFDEVEASKVLRRAAHPRVRGLRPLAGQDGARDRLRHRHGHDQLRPQRAPRSRSRSSRRSRWRSRKARGGLRAERPDRLPQRQRRGAESFVPAQIFDLVYSFGVIHHSPHPERIVEQVTRYVEPGSTFKVMVYNRRSWKVLWIVLKYGKGDFRKARELIAEHSEAQFGSPVTYAYTKKELEDLLGAAGFRVTDIFVDHIFPWRIPDYVEYRYVKVWYFRWIPERLFRKLERLLGWHLCATATYEPQKEVST